MSEKNTMNMEERLQVILLRAYAQKDLDVKQFPYVAMEADGSWYAHPIEPHFGKEKVWESMFCVALGVNGGVVDPEDSLFCWNAAVMTSPWNDIDGWIDRVGARAFADTLQAGVLAGRQDASATRTVWAADVMHEAFRIDVTVVAEPLPAPQEVPSMRRPTDEELDRLLPGGWTDVCPLDV